MDVNGVVSLKYWLTCRVSWLQGRASPGEGPGPGDKRGSSGAGDQPAAGVDPPAAARGDGGAGGGPGPPHRRVVVTRRHGKSGIHPKRHIVTSINKCKCNCIDFFPKKKGFMVTRDNFYTMIWLTD